LTRPFVLPVRGLVARPDGNNVSADREAMLLAEVRLQFKTATGKFVGGRRSSESGVLGASASC
jgi:flagellar basal body rod protein FlgB